MIQQGLMSQASWKTNETVEPVIVFKSFDIDTNCRQQASKGFIRIILFEERG